MSFASTRQALAYAADHLGHQMFESADYQENVKRSLDLADKWHQRECAMKAPLVMCFVFMMMLHRSLSLADLVVKLLFQYRSELPDLSLRAVTTEALCHARRRLGPEPLRLFFQAQAARVRPTPGPLGLRIWAIDGVAFSVADTPSNEAHFGRPKASRGETAFPQFKAVTLVDTTSRQIGGVVNLPPKGSERDGAVALLERVPTGDMVVLDRGYPAAWLFKLCKKKRIRVVARISGSWKPTLVKTLGVGDCIVEIRGEVPEAYRESLEESKRVSLRMRMVEYQIGDHERVSLLTDLMDPKRYPAVEIAKAYHLRWECEISYDEVKNHLAAVATGGLDLVFRSKTPDGVLQELYALLALYNMVRGLMAEAGRRHGVNPLDISFISTIRIIQETTPRYQAADEDQRPRIVDQLHKDIADLQNHRPRRPRQCPRAVRIKMTKFPLKRSHHYERQLHADQALRMRGGR